MGLPIRMRMFNNVKNRDVIYLKLAGIFSTSITTLELESKGSISSSIEENLLLYFLKFSTFLVVIII